MFTTKTTIYNKQYQYELIAQDFTLDNGKCLLVIRDCECGEITRITVESAFMDNHFLAKLSPKDVKIVGYVHACEINSKLHD